MKVFDDEKDKLLDHEYDGIRELDNHMPVWWLWLFYFTITFSIGYLLYYQVLGWGPTQEEQYEQEIAAAEAHYGGTKEDPVESYDWTFLMDEEAIEKGRELYMSNQQLCFSCHGAQGQGMVGPNLADEYWIHGCNPEDIARSIIDGFPEQGMLAYGSGNQISNENVEYLVSYIASLQGSNPSDAKEPDLSRASECEEIGSTENSN